METNTKRSGRERGIERLVDQHPLDAITLGAISLADAMRLGHHDVVGEYLGSTMSPAMAENTYRDIVSGVAGWY